MFKTVTAAAAALLLSLSPALAANLPHRDKSVAPDKTKIEDQTPVAAPSEQAADDDIQIIIMGKSLEVQVPNPYKNPSPRLITDAWAMRA